MTDNGFTLFDTAIGRCGIAWAGNAVTALHLPEADDDATVLGLRKRVPDARPAAPSPVAQRTIAAVAALLRGEAADLGWVPLALDRVPPFERGVYEIARTIAPGATLTYGEIARRLGQPGAARAVGRALGQNPFPIVVPCHRVLAAGGRIGGFTADGGVATKRRMLAIESVWAQDGPTLFDAPSPRP